MVVQIQNWSIFKHLKKGHDPILNFWNGLFFIFWLQVENVKGLFSTGSSSFCFTHKRYGFFVFLLPKFQMFSFIVLLLLCSPSSFVCRYRMLTFKRSSSKFNVFIFIFDFVSNLIISISIPYRKNIEYIINQKWFLIDKYRFPIEIYEKWKLNLLCRSQYIDVWKHQYSHFYVY